MEFFFQRVTIDFVSNSQHSLQDMKESKTILFLFQTFIHANPKIKEKRTPSGTFSKPLTASMTVEAALVVPIFLFCMMNVLFSFRMLETQSRVLAALHQVGNEICSDGYGPPLGVCAKVKKKIGNDFLEHSGVKKGAEGLSALGSQIRITNDIVDLQIHWKTRPLIEHYGFSGFSTGVRYYGRAWTGYEIGNAYAETISMEEMVYLTAHGEVYHCNHNCRYLNPTINKINMDEAGERRNQAGQSYTACETCCISSLQKEICYITPEGERYHQDPNCSGLKRTIRTVPLSAVGNAYPCSICGGEAAVW